jgi:nicotinamidase/pyrazinamidase
MAIVNGNRFDSAVSALLIIDVQPDFMPGGALACADGDAIVPPLKRLMDSGRFRHIVATQDWHPPGHISFASSHAGGEPMSSIELYGHEQTLWPDHCVQGSDGARLHPDLAWRHVDAVIRKGSDPAVDSYSGFRNNWNAAGKRLATGLAGYLRDRGIETVFLCGLARDVCVKWSAEDAVDAGFKTYFIWDLTRPVSYDSDPRTRRELNDKNVWIIESSTFD